MDQEEAQEQALFFGSFILRRPDDVPDVYNAGLDHPEGLEVDLHFMFLHGVLLGLEPGQLHLANGLHFPSLYFLVFVLLRLGIWVVGLLFLRRFLGVEVV